jgi:threonyl-tRNA synthetase
MLIVGEREEEDGTVALREHRQGDGGKVSVAEFTDRLRGRL